MNTSHNRDLHGMGKFDSLVPQIFKQLFYVQPCTFHKNTENKDPTFQELFI